MGPEHARAQREIELLKKKLGIAMKFLEDAYVTGKYNKENGTVYISVTVIEAILRDIKTCTV